MSTQSIFYSSQRLHLLDLQLIGLCFLLQLPLIHFLQPWYILFIDFLPPDPLLLQSIFIIFHQLVSISLILFSLFLYSVSAVLKLPLVWFLDLFYFILKLLFQLLCLFPHMHHLLLNYLFLGLRTDILAFPSFLIRQQIKIRSWFRHSSWKFDTDIIVHNR